MLLPNAFASANRAAAFAATVVKATWVRVARSIFRHEQMPWVYAHSSTAVIIVG